MIVAVSKQMLSADARSVAHERSLLGEILIAVLASSSIAFLAQISLSIGPVPITGQTLAVLGLSWVLGRDRALNAVGLYLAKGSLGLPVLAGGAAGPIHFVGPTAGYLIGFLVAALVVGSLSDLARARQMEKSGLLAALSFLAGTVSVYSVGLLFLSRFVSDALLQVGLIPFLPGDALKVMILVGLLPFLNRLSPERYATPE